jgi:uncharacterized protein (DUF302 family)
MAPQKLTTPITASRVTFKTTTSFAVVESRLVASIRRPSGAPAWPEIAKQIPKTPSAKPAFISGVEQVLGPHGFMEFWSVDHGAWLPIYAPPTSVSKVDGRALKCKRFVLGNPLIAITMLEHDLNAGLFVPVELLIAEDEDGKEGEGCRVLYMLPSGLVAGYEGASKELVDAARKLDAKLEILVQDITREG